MNLWKAVGAFEADYRDTNGLQESLMTRNRT